MMELAFQIAVAVVILIVILSMAKIKYRICRIVKPGSPLNGQVVSKTRVDDSRGAEPEWTPRVGEYVWMDMQNGGSSAKPVAGVPSYFKLKVLSASGKTFQELTVNAEEYRKRANTPGGIDSLYPRFALLQYDSNLQPKAVVDDVHSEIEYAGYGLLNLYAYGNDDAYIIANAIKSNGASPVSTHFVMISKGQLEKRDEHVLKVRKADYVGSDKPKAEIVAYLKSVGTRMGIDTSGATEYTTQEFRFPSAYHFYGDTPDENGMFAFVQYTLVLPNGDQRVSVLVKDIHDEGYSDNLQ